MGYCIDQGETEFTIKKENQAEALQALKNAVVSNPTTKYYDAQILASKTLKEALDAEYWEAELNEAGDIVGLYHAAEKLHDQETELSLISPFVEEGSFLQFSGEDHKQWRWVFKNKQLNEVYPVWPE